MPCLRLWRFVARSRINFVVIMCSVSKKFVGFFAGAMIEFDDTVFVDGIILFGDGEVFSESCN